MADSNLAAITAIKNFREKVLSSKLFTAERNDLKEYDKLRDMKFVLEDLLKLDLAAIAAKDVKKDDYLFENNQLNSYLGRK